MQWFVVSWSRWSGLTAAEIRECKYFTLSSTLIGQVMCGMGGGRGSVPKGEKFSSQIRKYKLKTESACLSCRICGFSIDLVAGCMVSLWVWECACV